LQALNNHSNQTTSSFMMRSIGYKLFYNSYKNINSNTPLDHFLEKNPSALS
jgi:hypothetical protein